MNFNYPSEVQMKKHSGEMHTELVNVLISDTLEKKKRQRHQKKKTLIAFSRPD